jgi:hypothetical protein
MIAYVHLGVLMKNLLMTYAIKNATTIYAISTICTVLHAYVIPEFSVTVYVILNATIQSVISMEVTANARLHAHQKN